MINFFKPEDFNDSHMENPLCSSCGVDAADMANAKLLSEGKVVYYKGEIPQISSSKPDKKALLINIEPIEKCKHPLDKVVQKSFSYRDASSHGFDAGMLIEKTTYQCECGAKVKPVSFEEVK